MALASIFMSEVHVDIERKQCKAGHELKYLVHRYEVSPADFLSEASFVEVEVHYYVHWGIEHQSYKLQRLSIGEPPPAHKHHNRMMIYIQASPTLQFPFQC